MIKKLVFIIVLVLFVIFYVKNLYFIIYRFNGLFILFCLVL